LDRPEYLYLLIEKETLNCKIGISVDPLQRSYVLKQKFDYEKSKYIEIPKKKAKTVESFLHLLCTEHHLKHSEPFDGHTEWFSSQAFDKAYEFINSQKIILNLEEWLEFTDQIRYNSTLPITKPFKNKIEYDAYVIYNQEQKLKQIESNKENNIRCLKELDTLLSILNLPSCKINKKKGLVHISNENPTSEQFNYIKKLKLLTLRLSEYSMVNLLSSWEYGYTGYSFSLSINTTNIIGRNESNPDILKTMDIYRKYKLIG
jgi:hypothetical protein